MKKKTNIALMILYLIFILCACTPRTEFQINSLQEEDLRPAKIMTYLDCSYSLKGFFESFSGETEAKELLTNISGQARRENIQMEYHKFDKVCDSLTNDFQEFSLRGLSPSFFSCGENRYSAAFESMLSKLGQSEAGEEIFLVFSDGVPSLSSDSRDFGIERAELIRILSDYRKYYPTYGLGIFHYTFVFNGAYPLQPDVVRNVRSEVKYVNRENESRNFFVLAFYPLKYQAYLNTLLDNEPNYKHRQYFHRAYTEDIKLSTLCNSGYMAEHEISLFIQIDTLYKSVEQRELLATLQIWDQDSEERLDPQIELSNLTRGKWEINLEFSEVEMKDIKRLDFRLNKKNSILAIWDSLSTQKDLFETEENYSSNLTYRLDLLLDVFENVFKDSHVYQCNIAVGKSKHSPLAYPYIWMGEEKDSAWDNGLYMWLTIISVSIAALAVILFYVSGFFNNSSTRDGNWLLVGFCEGVACAIVSCITILYTPSESCESFSLLTHGITYSLFNSIYSGLIFFVLSLIVRSKNSDLQDVPSWI